LTRLRVAVGIPCYNERKNIGVILDRIVQLVPNIVQEILVVSSSTNGTDNLVHQYKHQSVHLIHTPREGKASAWNLIIKEAETRNCQILIYMGGDNLPSRDAIPLLLKHFEKPQVGIVGGHPMPLSYRNTFLSWYGELQWMLHHLASERYEPKISGELCAMRVGIIREMPPAIINDDVYLQELFKLRGWGATYEPSAYVYLQSPKTLHDLIRQRYRIYVGHHQARYLLGRKPVTVQYRTLKLLLEAMPDMEFRSYLFLLVSILLQGILYLVAKIGAIMGDLPYRWTMAESTKQLQFGM
jgi:biofilm PGA synthesis N-glycosyltransferase PgaC